MQNSKSINQISSREAMGLTKHFCASKIDDLSSTFCELKAASIEQLVNIAESTTAEFKKRYVAGQLLGLQGDPRLICANPIMLEIPEDMVTIGINQKKLTEVLDQYASVGVTQAWLLKEAPQFSINIKRFKIGKYQVTNQEYREFLLDTQFLEIPSSWKFGIYPVLKANHPVYTVSEIAADAYTHWLSQKTQRKFRLPSEYEWEYAASGIEHFDYPWGRKYRSDCANTVEEKIYDTTPVGIFAKGHSVFGVADMAGNVEEYVADEYHPYPKGVYINDELLSSNERYRVCRGGSFSRYADLARTTRRHGFYKKDIYVIGFRLAEDI